ncbi:MAG: 4Fe-4S dicluster domain-containing protein [Candidatus Omnitrophica bacterium]|nr:4Fe-4S dicluster domain-containing protein [Candidatus Omnitrophota bacterium]
MSKYVLLKKSNLNDFITKLSSAQKVVAPIAKGYNQFAFEQVTEAQEVALQYIPTILPPKKFFMPQCETIQEFNKNEKTWAPVLDDEELVIFGVHTCDLAGIQFLNTVMGSDPKDANYLNRKEKITVIGLECNDYCDEYASCAVMRNHLPDGGYDLFLTELADDFIVHVASEKGEKIVADTGCFEDADDAAQAQLKDLRAKKEEIFKCEVDVANEDLKPLFTKSFESPVWEDVGKRCVTCGNCTAVCPTCYCFDIRDELNLDFNTGIRYRVWDGCQSENFAKVAGNENFREERDARQRHRYMRKFNYPVTKYSQYACTGCGRCSRTCMAKINLKETINAIAKDV